MRFWSVRWRRIREKRVMDDIIKFSAFGNIFNFLPKQYSTKLLSEFDAFNTRMLDGNFVLSAVTFQSWQ